MLKNYLKALTEISNRGDAREESFYSALETLLKNYAESANRKNIHITVLPKKTEAGNPDFRVWDGKQHITGYLEAKHPSLEYLDQVETSEQFKRYLNTFPNLILTNFFEFRLYRNSKLIHKVSVARTFTMQKLKTVPAVENETEFFRLLEQFFSFSLPEVYDAKTLAVELARRTRFLRDEVITVELKNEQHQEKKFITGFYEAFKKYLIAGLTKEEFADLYSQTVTYGLFAARTRATNSFSRKLAYDYIPETIGILRDVFRFVSLGDPPPQMEWIIDDISEVLAVTNVYNILKEYYHQHKGKDPIVHFYETFLAEYDPETREKRGVYYTPEPVVSYIVRSLHKILKKNFNKSDGLADSNVTVLDPAAGTLTFLAEATRVAVREISRYGEGIIEPFMKEHILKNFYAFELMMAPYAIGHIKMSFLLEELGYKLQKDERFQFYLTNALEIQELEQTELPGMATLSEESHLAGVVKKETPILVVLGNPPYSGHSANINEWIEKLLKEDVDGLQSFYKVDEKPLAEKNPKWLQDDYVKFIRFAQWKINKTGEGVLGFITNHSYIDNPTFRGMRQSLMKTFDEIYILNLHGSSLKKEKCPDGSKDENVFDIKQGVAIALFIKRAEKKPEILHPLFKPSPQKGLFEREPPSEKTKKHKCNVYYAEIWGLREKKYDWLLEHDIEDTKWKKLSPKSEYYLFIPREDKLFKIYEKYSKITDIFQLYSVGIVTARDEFVIDCDKEALKRRIGIFIDENLPDEIIRQSFHLKDKSNWKIKRARENVKKLQNWQDFLFQILYRPFDVRWIFYNEAIVERTRSEVMNHMKQKNLGLITIRRSRSPGTWNYSFVTDKIIAGATAITSLDINYLFP
ncbi:MAG: type ISP restriction/modification enzyme, partial [candidate division WOR-3 bacterium]